MAKSSGGVPASNPSPYQMNDPVLSELAAYARPMDYGTAPELMALREAQHRLERPDPDGDGDPLDGGMLGVMDFKGGCC